MCSNVKQNTYNSSDAVFVSIMQIYYYLYFFAAEDTILVKRILLEVHNYVYILLLLLLFFTFAHLAAMHFDIFMFVKFTYNA